MATFPVRSNSDKPAAPPWLFEASLRVRFNRVQQVTAPVRPAQGVARLRAHVVAVDVLLWVEKKLLLVEEEPVLSFTTELLRRQVSEFRQRAEKAINLVVQFAQFRSPFMALRVYLYK